MWWSSKCKIAIWITAILGAIVWSICTSSFTITYMENLIDIKYDMFTKINDTTSSEKITSTSHLWRQPQAKTNPPSSQATRPHPFTTPMSSTINNNHESRGLMDIQADIQRLRRTQLKAECSKHLVNTNQESSFPSNMIVDEKYKLVYCYVPKVACTSWKRVFLVLNGAIKHTDDLKQFEVNNKIGPRKLNFIKSYNISKRAEILQSYTKFLVVRHPFQRVLSAFQNKLWAGSTSPSSGPFQRKIGLHILKKYRPNTVLNNKSGSIERKTLVTKNKRNITYDLRFDEFVSFLTNETERESLLRNYHWREIYQLCQPCQVDYDIISHFETLVDDARYILHLVHADDIVEFPSSKGSSPTNSSSESVYKSYYADVPHRDLEKLYRKYRLDFELFGYDKPDVLL